MYYYIYNYNIQYTADTFTKFIPNYIKNEITQSSGSTQKYKVIRELGRGGYGDVFLVSKDNKYYALKKIFIKNLEKEEIENCYNEIKIMSSLNNNYIIKCYDCYEENGYLNIIMEYGGDKNLDIFIKNQNKGIEEDIIKKIVLQICNGLKEIHNANIVHRDLIPGNIFINTNNYSIKIGDFGISSKLETNQNFTYTMKGTGNFSYMPPEIIEGCKSKITNKVDIYSLGCIIYELFNKRRYHDDKMFREEGPKKIDTDLYNEKWQNLIDTLLEIEDSKRPNIEQVIQYISNIN